MKAPLLDNLCTASELAAKMKVSNSYVSCMKRKGYQFSHGRWTTYEHAMRWIARNPWFRTTNTYPKRTRRVTK